MKVDKLFTTRIFNNEKVLKTEQVLDILKLIDKPKFSYHLFKLCIIDELNDIEDLNIGIYCISDISEIAKGELEYKYLPKLRTLYVFTFAQNYSDYSFQDKQLYSIYALIHGLRNAWQSNTKFNEDEELDCDSFTVDFMKKNSSEISRIMGFEDEWEVIEIES